MPSPAVCVDVQISVRRFVTALITVAILSDTPSSRHALPCCAYSVCMYVDVYISAVFCKDIDNSRATWEPCSAFSQTTSSSKACTPCIYRAFKSRPYP
jgi:hypothetical protein